MSPATVAFRLDRARRVAFGCLLPVLYVIAAFLIIVFATTLLTGNLGPLALFATIGSLVLATSFGLILLLVTIQEWTRAVRDGPVIIVGPGGLELTGVGMIPWADIDRICLERRLGFGAGSGTDNTPTRYRRVAIFPRDPSIARRRFLGAAAMRIQGFFGWAPLGVFDYELERPIDDLIEVIRGYATLEECR